jgi:alpha-beta hydrolase superfamily lysophospholipase
MPCPRQAARPGQRTVEDHSFATHDGTSLQYRRWPALAAVPRGAVLLFHRGHEHGGRMAHLVDELDLPGFEFYAWDARGHGRSPGERGYAPSFTATVRDVQTFVDHLAARHGVSVEKTAVVAQSVGAVTVAAWAHDYAPRLRALVLAAPAFAVKLYVPFARPGLALLQKLRGNFFVQSYVKAGLLTHDPARRASFDADPLITRAISVNILLEMHETARRVVRDARAITIPTQLLIPGADVVVERQAQHDFFVNLGSPTKERHAFPGFFHDILGEAGRAAPIEKARQFIVARFADELEAPDLSQADRSGYTRDEAARLASPLPVLSGRGLFWRSYRGALRVGALLSHGIALGRRTGFDSGSTLDYVYRNQAAGRGPLGRLVDRGYLDAIGWRGIRQRKIHVEELLQRALQRLADTGQPARILDIAAGHGRYILEALAGAERLPESILLRDYSALNVDAAGRLIAEKGLAAIARCEQADAFDGPSIAALAPKPTLAVVSGLYELFPDNAMVGRSLAGLAAAVPAGGFLVYTGQPWHPQIEMIARALTSHRDGQAWVMRRRTQAELDQLLAAAGFRKLEQRIDPWGIFTVSLAVRDGHEDG